MKTIKFEEEQFRFLINYLKARIKSTEWVLDNKHPDNKDQLMESVDKLNDIVCVLEEEDE